MPADMLIKIVRVGIPILVSNAAPAGSGYEIAKKGNITMVGFLDLYGTIVLICIMLMRGLNWINSF